MIERMGRHSGADIIDPTAVRCAECGREVDEFAAIAERWAYRSDRAGELVPMCPECARRTFAPDAPPSAHRAETRK